MKLTRFHDARACFERAEHFLLEFEAHHNLIFGILSTLIDDPARYPDPYLAVVEEAGEVRAVALRTPPHNLIVSRVAEDGALEPLLNDLKASALPGVLGPKETARAFAESWQTVTRRPYQLKMAQRIYQLTHVIPPRPVPGALRQATETDRELLIDWFAHFDRDTGLGAGSRDVAEKNAEAYLKRMRLYLWEIAGVPVSMAGWSGPTPNGIRVNAVYTPPEHRKKGYASACVAALSQKLLDEGRRYCFLFTDLANPTSNKIYQAIGYEPVCDVNQYTFES